LDENPVQASLKLFLDAIPLGPLSVETLPLLSARGRRLAENVSARIDDPPYSRSIMEGYVVCISDLAAASSEQPVSLEVLGSIPVGQGHAEGLMPGKALQVTTGSFIPAGDFAVLRAWNVSRNGDTIAATQPVKKGENIEVQGEFRRKGACLLKKGAVLSSSDVFLLASQGIVTLPLAAPPRVALFSSGNEVIPADADFRLGSIWDCNRYGLSSLIEEAGGIPLFQGIMADDFDLFKKKIQDALESADMLVISGGTSVGRRDFTADLIDEAGSPGTLIKGIPMRSGKPIILGAVGEKPMVCVAGHPPEAARGFALFAQPMIAHLMGMHTQEETANDNMA